jgi:ATP-binding cassette subfamily B multidrug efflux pump
MSDERKPEGGAPQGGAMPGRGNAQRGGGPIGAMGRPVEKAKDFKGTLKRLIGYLMAFKVRFIAVFVLAAGSTVFSIIGPKILGYATTKLADGIVAQVTHKILVQTAIAKNMPASVIHQLQMQPVPKFDFAYIGMIILILIGLYLLSALLSFVMGFLMSTVSQKTVFKMRNDVKEKLDKLPLKYFDNHTHGEILSRVTNDIDNIATTLQQSLGQLITSLVTILGTLVMMISISPVMTLIALVTLPLSAMITMRIAKQSQKYYAAQQERLGELSGHVEEMYTGHKIVKVLAREYASIKEFKRINHELYKVANRAQFMSGVIMPVLNFVNNVGYVAVCVVGGILVSRNAIKIGDIQAFIQYIRTFTQPIIQTANIANIIQSTIASAERVFEVLDEQEQIPDREDAAERQPSCGEVRFEHVRFSYKDDAPLIEDMNLTAKPGDTVAIVGPTGAGKTTLVNLLMRFYEIQEGSIRIDGIDIRDMKRGDLRQLFGMVLQDTWLFNGTIRDNIAYGRDDATEEQIIAAAKAAHADHFISSLPDGYDTVLNEEATNISQGQKQLLTIARAILADPAILILDEATSNVDTRSEVLIQKAMATLMKGRTSFVIAHRLSTIREAEHILVMNRGSIIEQGNHKELLRLGGFYADLYNSQFSGAFVE